MAYFALIPSEGVELVAGPRVESVQWWPIDEAMSLHLAFDHNAILAAALDRVRAKVEYTSLAVSLLPETFTLPELQRIHEIVLGRVRDKSAFRTRMLAADILEPTGETRASGKRRAVVYRRKPQAEHVIFPRMFYA
ncbi:MAG: hypothetical protein P4L87_01035 [Formivibrio sp.]|nr:hypothetical protein [Formivibrio sp.]